MTPIDDVRQQLADAADLRKAAGLHRYFQTGPGGYGAGDVFLGVSVPAQRKIAGRHWRAMSLAQLRALLASGWHEERLTALFILVHKFQNGSEAEQQAIVELVLDNTDRINNWDLVDASAPYIVGPWLLDRDKSVLERLAASDRVWDRRIAIMATFAFIRAGRFDWTFALAARLLDDDHDLVHKAVGWMLREVGNRNRAAEEEFLARHYRVMPRVMLRYAIEKFPAERRQLYLSRPTA
jgi:3-methyladenine DNA glycosylase AlkD